MARGNIGMVSDFLLLPGTLKKPQSGRVALNRDHIKAACLKVNLESRDIYDEGGGTKKRTNPGTSGTGRRLLKSFKQAYKDVLL